MITMPRLAALAVLPHQGNVLLVRRRNPPDQGLWGYPGGKVDPGERVSEAATRELFEETGVRAEALQQLSGLDIIGHDGAGGLAWHFFLVPVLCRYLSGEAVAADDAAEAAWFPEAEVLSCALPMSRDVDLVLRNALREFRQGTHPDPHHEAAILRPTPL